MLALIALVIGLLVAAYSRSLAAGLVLTAAALGGMAAVAIFAVWRERRLGRERRERCLRAIEAAAAAEQAVIDTAFVDDAAEAAFGVAAAAGRVYFAHGFHARQVDGFAVDEVTAAFARPDGARGYRIEMRVRPEARSPAPPRWLRTASGDEARRWISTLEPLSGARAKWVRDEKGERGEE